MNQGLAIFKKVQRLQGGTEKVVDQGDLAERYAAALALAKRQRAEAMNETGDYGNSPDVIYPEELEAKHKADQIKAEQAMARAMGMQHYAEGVNNVGLGYDSADPRNNLTRGFNSGVPTQRGFGMGANIAGNFVFPGLGMLTGPLASWLTRMYQNMQGRNAVQNATAPYQTGGDTGGTTSTTPATDDTTDTTDQTSTTPTAPTEPTTQPAGVGIDPYGNPANPGQWWSNDFGRWNLGPSGQGAGSYNLAGPGGWNIGARGLGFSGTSVPVSSDPNFMPTLGWAMPAASGGGAYGGNTMAKIALHSGRFRDAATPEQFAFMQNFLQGGGGGGGSGQGVGGAGRPMTMSRQLGDSNVGLNLFRRTQMLKNKKP